MSRRRKRKSLEGSKWRRRGPIEDSILQKLSTLDKTGLTQVANRFITSLMLNGSASISVRQQWYLAFVASRTDAKFSAEETDWINDKISQECPEGFGERRDLTQVGYKPTQKALSGDKPTHSILLGAERKIRT